jgi:DNA-binding CsgD family transcriptional regulator
MANKRPSAIHSRDKDILVELIKGLKSDVVTASGRSDRLGLTRRELEVIRLVAQGRNNSEVADALFISVNTVTRHMTNIFAKTETTNRVEAALLAARNGLL